MAQNWKNIFKLKKENKRTNFLNGGLYRNIFQKLNLFVGNVKKNFLHGFVRIENIVRINVGTEHIKNFLQEDGRTLNSLNVKSVEKSLGYKKIDSKQEEENIVQENVMEKQNLKKLQEKEIPNILMGEQKNMQKHFIFQKSGENYEKKFIKEIIMDVQNVERKESYMPTIKYQWESVKIPYKNQILLPCVDFVTQRNIVLNNRQEVQNGFFK